MGELLIAERQDLQDIANKLKAKTGKTDGMSFPNGFINAIDELGQGGSGSGNVELNIHYGDSEPTDKTKLWVKANRPNNVIISPEITGNETMTLRVGLLGSKSSYGCVPAAQVDGKIYLFRGASAGGNVMRFYPETGELVTLEGISVGNVIFSTSVAIIKKKIYLCPWSSSGKTNTIYIFDTETETVSTMSLGDSLYDRTIAAVGDVLYLFGGYSEYLNRVTNNYTIFAYNTATGATETIGTKLPNDRRRMASVTIGTKIYLIGGASFRTSYLNTIYIFDTTDESITTASVTLPVALTCATAIAVGTDIYIFGGSTGSSTSTKNILKYDTLNDTIETIETTLKLGTYNMGAVLLDSDIYLVGGVNINTIDKFTIQSSLNTGEVKIQTTMGKPPLFEIMSNPTLKTNIKNVFVGNSEGYAEPVEAYLYQDGVWTQI